MAFRVSLLALLVSGSLAGGAHAAEKLLVSRAGEWLANSLDRLDVEHYWLRSHHHIAWRTGFPLLKEHSRRLTPLGRDESHCSAFAAAAADSLGIYLLHPPEHSHVLLANAQFDWLSSAKGRKVGWRAVGDPLEAQRRANQGEFVVAVFKNPRPKSAGHIAVIRPAAAKPARVEAKGPQVMQAGFNNYRSAPLANGIDHHPGAWQPGGGAVKFFTHAVDPKAVAGE